MVISNQYSAQQVLHTLLNGNISISASEQQLLATYNPSLKSSFLQLHLLLTLRYFFAAAFEDTFSSGVISIVREPSQVHALLTELFCAEHVEGIFNT